MVSQPKNCELKQEPCTLAPSYLLPSMLTVTKEYRFCDDGTSHFFFFAFWGCSSLPCNLWLVVMRLEGIAFCFSSQFFNSKISTSSVASVIDSGLCIHWRQVKIVSQNFPGVLRKFYEGFTPPSLSLCRPTGFFEPQEVKRKKAVGVFILRGAYATIAIIVSPFGLLWNLNPLNPLNPLNLLNHINPLNPLNPSTFSTL